MKKSGMLYNTIIVLNFCLRSKIIIWFLLDNQTGNKYNILFKIIKQTIADYLIICIL